MQTAHKYLYIVDETGTYWLVGPNRDSYFNGAVWVNKSQPIRPKEILGEATIEEFLVILKTTLNHGQAL